MADTLEILEYLTLRSPFGGNSTLHSISLWITADATVNCDCGWPEGTGRDGRENHHSTTHIQEKRPGIPPQQHQYHQC